MERNLADVRCVFAQLKGVEAGVVRGEGHGLFGKPTGVGRPVHLFKHHWNRYCPDAHAKTTSFGFDVERDIENSPHITVIGCLFGRVKSGRGQVHLNGRVREQVHEIEDLDVGSPRYGELNAAGQQGTIDGVGFAGHNGVAWIGALMVNDAVICDGLQGTIDAYFRVFAVVAHQHGERRTFPCGVMVSVTTQGSEGQIQT